jgi:hypothetical protein
MSLVSNCASKEKTLPAALMLQDDAKKAPTLNWALFLLSLAVLGLSHAIAM